MNENSKSRDGLKQIMAFTGLNRTMGAMLAMVVLVGLGEKMAERFLPLYLLALGAGTQSVGFLNAMDNLLGALYSFPGGHFSDRWGARRALMAFTVLAMAGYVVVILVPAWWAVLAGAVLFISWTAVSLPGIMSLVSNAVPKDRRVMGVTLHSLVRRIPMALGPILGGILIGRYGTVQGVRIAFTAALAMGGLSLWIQWRFIADFRERKTEPLRLSESWKAFSPALRSLLASDILIRFAEQIPYAFVVVWVVREKGLTAAQFGTLTAVEMVTAMLVYIPVAAMADRYGKKPFVLMTFGFFTAFPLALLFCRSFSSFVLAFALRGLKEFGEPTRKALIMDLAPEGAKASTFGTYYLIRDVIVSGAALSSATLWNIAPSVNFLTAFGFGVAGTFLFALFGKDVHHKD
ncbi:MAG: MFS transporter [Synergistales bacterium]|jgi:MFS family permease